MDKFEKLRKNLKKKHEIKNVLFFPVDRVQEAEREVSRMLLKSIEHHIQDAGKALLKTDEGILLISTFSLFL